MGSRHAGSCWSALLCCTAGSCWEKQPANARVSLLKSLAVVFEGPCKDGASVQRMQDSIHKAPALLKA